MKLDDENWHCLTVSRRDPKTGKFTMEKVPVYHIVDDEKKKKVVKLICMVKGQKFEEEKEVQDFEVTVDDIDLILERARRIRPTLFLENVGE